MAEFAMPKKWSAAQKLFPHQVGFTCPPFDYDAAPSDFLRMSPETVGVHGWMLHVPDYTHGLDQRKANFGMMEDFVHCMSRNGADVCGQVADQSADTTADQAAAFEKVQRLKLTGRFDRDDCFPAARRVEARTFQRHLDLRTEFCDERGVSFLQKIEWRREWVVSSPFKNDLRRTVRNHQCR